MHMGAARLQCCSGDQGAYRTPAPCSLLEGGPVAAHPISCRFHLVVLGPWYSEGLQFSKESVGLWALIHPSRLRVLALGWRPLARENLCLQKAVRGDLEQIWFISLFTWCTTGDVKPGVSARDRNPCACSLSRPGVWPGTAEVLGAGTPALHALLHRTNLACSLTQAGEPLCKACMFFLGAVTWEGEGTRCCCLWLKDRSGDGSCTVGSGLPLRVQGQKPHPPWGFQLPFGPSRAGDVWFLPDESFLGELRLEKQDSPSFTPHLLEAPWPEGPEVLCCPAAHPCPAVLIASCLGIKGAL